MKHINYMVLIGCILYSGSSLSTEFSLFGNTKFSRGNDENQNFALGELEFVSKASISDSTSVTVDFLFEIEGQEVETEIERLHITKTINKYLDIGLGRYMEPLGFWNQNFIHGTINQDTIDRPYFIDLEYEHKSVLPTHVVGGVLSGETELFTYQIALANVDGIDTADNNHAGATTLNSNTPSSDLSTIIRLTYKATDHLELGLLALSSDIVETEEHHLASDNSLVEAGEILFERQAIGLDLFYSNHYFYFFSEFYKITYDDNQSIVNNEFPANPDSYEADLYYAQAGLYLNKELSVSLRHESLDFSVGSTFFEIQDILPYVQNTLAMRYRIAESHSLKLQASELELDGDKQDTVISVQWYFLLL